MVSCGAGSRAAIAEISAAAPALSAAVGEPPAAVTELWAAAAEGRAAVPESLVALTRRFSAAQRAKGLMLRDLNLSHHRLGALLWMER